MTCRRALRIDVAGDVLIGFAKQGRITRARGEGADPAHRRFVGEHVYASVSNPLSLSLPGGTVGFATTSGRRHVYVARIERTMDAFSRRVIYVHALLFEKAPLIECGVVPRPWAIPEGYFVTAREFERTCRRPDASERVDSERLPTLKKRLELPQAKRSYDSRLLSYLIRHGFRRAITYSDSDEPIQILDGLLMALPHVMEVDLKYLLGFVPEGDARAFHVVLAKDLRRAAGPLARERTSYGELKRILACELVEPVAKHVPDLNTLEGIVNLVRQLRSGDAIEGVLDLNQRLKNAGNLDQAVAQLAEEAIRPLRRSDALRLFADHARALLSYTGENRRHLVRQVLGPDLDVQSLTEEECSHLERVAKMLGTFDDTRQDAKYVRSLVGVCRMTRSTSKRFAERPLDTLLRAFRGRDDGADVWRLAVSQAAGVSPKAWLHDIRAVLVSPDNPAFQSSTAELLAVVSLIGEPPHHETGRRLFKAFWQLLRAPLSGRPDVMDILLYQTREPALLAQLALSEYRHGRGVLHRKIEFAIGAALRRATSLSSLQRVRSIHSKGRGLPAFPGGTLRAKHNDWERVVSVIGGSSHESLFSWLLQSVASSGEAELPGVVDDAVKFVERVGTVNGDAASRLLPALWSVLQALKQKRVSLIDVLLYRRSKVGLLAGLTQLDRNYGAQVLHRQLDSALASALS